MFLNLSMVPIIMPHVHNTFVSVSLLSYLKPYFYIDCQTLGYVLSYMKIFKLCILKWN